MKLSPAQLDRACGAVLGTAVGDALGAPYEFGLATVGPEGPRMIGGGLGGFAPGEWTDDTTMSWAILDVAATGADLRSEEALTQIARNFRAWYDSRPPDIGNQTRTILGAVGADPTGAAMTDDVVRPARPDRSHRWQRLADAHGAGRAAVPRRPGRPRRGRTQGRCADPLRPARPGGLRAVVAGDPPRDPARRARHPCRSRLPRRRGASPTGPSASTRPSSREPGRFRPNGWAVAGPPSGVVRDRPHARPDRGPRRVATSSTASPPPSGSATTPTPSPRSPARCSVPGGALRPSRLSGDGSRHGYPGLRGERLVELAHLAANKGPGVYDWPLADHIDYSIYGSAKTLVQHPYDDGVWLADASALDDLPDDSHGRRQPLPPRPASRSRPDLEHVGYRLIDHADPAVNPNLDFMLADAARTIATLRDEGHVSSCTASPPRVGRRPSESPTPCCAASTAPRRSSAVCAVLPAARPNAGFRAALKRLEGRAFRLEWPREPRKERPMALDLD